MEQQIEVDHFKVLEEKVESLIKKVSLLREEKDFFKKKFKEQEQNTANLRGELERLKQIRDNTKNRIVTILEKIKKMDS